MSEKNPLFRKAALDKLSSPERLDVLMQVTSPKGWLALATIAGLLAGVIVWAIVGSIPERLQGKGMLIRGGALREIKAAGAGTIAELKLAQGAIVKADEQIGRIERRDVAAGASESRINEMRMRGEVAAVRAEVQAEQLGLRSQISSLEEEIARVDSQISKAEAEVALRQDQIARGLATRQQVLTAERDVESLRVRRSQTQTQIRSTQTRIAQGDQQIRAAEIRAANASSEVKIKDVGLEVVSQIKSEVEGRIIELRVKQGDIVQAGSTLAVVEPLDAELQTIIYVDYTKARQIRKAMEAQISPSEIRREEFGFIKGSVVSISDAPVTMEKMARDLANQTLAQELYGKVAPIEVRAVLNPAKSENATGFEWSTSAGPPFPIAGNSRINVDIVVDRRKPYTYVLPMIKSAIGAS